MFVRRNAGVYDALKRSLIDRKLEYKIKRNRRHTTWEAKGSIFSGGMPAQIAERTIKKQ